jgi:hypothetical protein
VIGIGLNVRMPPAARKDIAVPVTDLSSIARRKTPVDRNRLLATAGRAHRRTRALRARRVYRIRRRVAAPPRVPGKAVKLLRPMGRASPAKSPASMRAARSCSLTARAAPASFQARSRCGARWSPAGPASQGRNCPGARRRDRGGGTHARLPNGLPVLVHRCRATAIRSGGAASERADGIERVSHTERRNRRPVGARLATIYRGRRRVVGVRQRCGVSLTRVRVEAQHDSAGD